MEIIRFNLEELKKNLDGFSCYILGRSYDLEENGATENFNEALKYYSEGMNLNYPLCEYSLGISLILGLGNILKIDKEKGTKLLIDAYPKILNLINNKNLSLEERLYAKFVIGAYHYYGLGNVEKNDKKAFNIIQECANKGHIAAIYDLGANFYYNGVGTERDIEKAKYYLQLACEEGLPRAIKKYDEYGFGTLKSKIKGVDSNE
ncbi:MAG: tetratricopeptide repeat protein [Bacilli bacterium]|nr:tetratricopeptide repeat protein [Bacilli bacterium]